MMQLTTIEFCGARTRLQSGGGRAVAMPASEMMRQKFGLTRVTACLTQRLDRTTA